MNQGGIRPSSFRPPLDSSPIPRAIPSLSYDPTRLALGGDPAAPVCQSRRHQLFLLETAVGTDKPRTNTDNPGWKPGGRCLFDRVNPGPMIFPFLAV